MFSEMKIHFKESAPGYGVIFGIAVLDALIVRVVLAIMGAQGHVFYQYDPSSAGSKIDQLAGLLLAVPLMGLVLTCLIVGALFLACHAWAGRTFYKNQFGPAPTSTESKFLTTLIWFIAATIVALLVFVIITSGWLSAIQLKVIMNKAGSGGGGAATALLFAGVLITLLAASIGALYAAICRAHAKMAAGLSDKDGAPACPYRVYGLEFALGTLIVGLVVGIAGGQVFGELNTVKPGEGLNIYLGVALIANVIIATASHLIAKGVLGKRGANA